MEGYRRQDPGRNSASFEQRSFERCLSMQREHVVDYDNSDYQDVRGKFDKDRYAF